MKYKLLFITTLLTLLTALHIAGKQPAKPQPAKPSISFEIESERNITSPEMPGGIGHAATIVQTKKGTILAAWYSIYERTPETDVWMSRYDPKKGAWSVPYKVFDGDEVGKDFTTENPVLFQPRNGPLMLFVKVGPAAHKKFGNIYRPIRRYNMPGYLKVSHDDGQTWSPPKLLGKSDKIEGGYLIGPTKNPPIELEDGTILVPSSNEYGLMESQKWEEITFHFEKSTDGGKTWQFVFKCPKAPDIAKHHIMQPGFLRLRDGRLIVLGRDNTPAHGRDPVPFAISSDNGRTWSTITQMTTLQHNKAAICPLTLRDSTHICIVNRYPGSSERDELDLMVSEDGFHWSHGITIQGTDGVDAHYPQAVQTADGKIHVVYTYGDYGRPGKPGIIRHVVIRVIPAARKVGKILKLHFPVFFIQEL